MSALDKMRPQSQSSSDRRHRVDSTAMAPVVSVLVKTKSVKDKHSVATTDYSNETLPTLDNADFRRTPSGKHRVLPLVTDSLVGLSGRNRARRASISSPIDPSPQQLPARYIPTRRPRTADSMPDAYTYLRPQPSVVSLSSSRSSMPPPARPARNPARPLVAVPLSPSQIPVAFGRSQGPVSAFKSLKRPSSSCGFMETHATQTAGGISSGPAVLRKRSLTGTPHADTNSSAAPSTYSLSSNVPSQTKPDLPPPPTSQRAAQFSTVDRTILEELRRNLMARDAQFIMKNGKKHHPYASSIVPYPRSYERTVIDHDVWETSFVQQMCKSITWHMFEKPPTKVLELGCGTGAWILDAARVWKKTQFVGLDIVPLHPDLQRIGSSDLASRVAWMQANFLEGLPFPNEEFDYVRAMRIGRGVPEDKWDAFMEEVLRVMKPGGAIELIEEDLYFPGSRTGSFDSEPSGFIPLEMEITGRPMRTRGRKNPGSISDLSSPNDSDAETTDSNMEETNTTPATSTSAPSLVDLNLGESTPTPTADKVQDVERTRRTMSSPLPASLSPEAPPSPRQTGTRNMTLPQPVQRRPDPGINIPNSEPKRKSSLTALRTSRSQLANVAKTRRESTNPFEIRARRQTLPANDSMSNVESSFGNRSQTSMPRVVVNDGTPRNSLEESITPMASQTSTLKSNSKVLYHPSPSPPSQDPRNHSLLQIIHKEMHAARFINLSPLALLPNLLGLHFENVRTHSPFVLSFPPVFRQATAPRRPKAKHGRKEGDTLESTLDSEGSSSLDDEVDSDPGLHQSLYSRHSSQSRTSIVSREDVYFATQPYLLVDRTHLPMVQFPHRSQLPHNPSNQSHGESRLTSSVFLERCADAMKSGLQAGSMMPFPLPNPTVEFDPRSLHLHLSARVQEVLACAESMWEWVLEYQARCRRLVAEGNSLFFHEGKLHRNGGMPIEPNQRPGLMLDPDPGKKAIREMTRLDFDACLARFEMDMRNQIGLGPAMENNLNWHCMMPSLRSEEQQAFDVACERWDQAHVIDASKKRDGEDFRWRSGVPSHQSPQHAHDQSSQTRHSNHPHQLPMQDHPRSRRQSHLPHPGTDHSKPNSVESLKPSRSFRIFCAWKASS